MSDRNRPTINFHPTVETQNAEELAVIGHLRGWCHDSKACALCTAQDAARKANDTLDSIISG